jgi:hypothetical protein
MSGLSKHWRNWRKRRKHELIAQGLDAASARLWSGREARCKQDTEALIGREATIESDLVVKIRFDGTYAMYVSVPVRAIPTEYLGRAKAWDGPAASSASH